MSNWINKMAWYCAWCLRWSAGRGPWCEHCGHGDQFEAGSLIIHDPAPKLDWETLRGRK